MKAKDPFGTPPPPSATDSLTITAITSSYLPIIGGTEVEVQRVCSALRDRGHRILILCPGGPPMPPVAHWTDPCGLQVRIIGNKLPSRLRLCVFALTVGWTILRAESPGVAYFIMPGLHVAIGMLAARLAGQHIFMKYSGTNEIRKLTRSPVGRWQLRLVRRWAECIMVLNPAMFAEAEEAGLDPDTLVWMPNPVDTTVFKPSENGCCALRERFGLPPHAPIIIFVGRLAPEKELSSLVRAFHMTRPAHPGATLLLVGDGPCRGELERLASDLEMATDVKFTGAVDVNRIPQYLQCADVFALVSSLEGFPVSLIEAMATGMACVVSGISANTQLVQHEETGLVAELRRESSIAEALSRALGDAALRARLGAAARRSIVSKYATDIVVEQYERRFSHPARTSTK